MMKTLFLFVLLSAAGLFAVDQTAPLKTETFKLGDWEDDIGYRQAVRVGRTVYVSGSVGAGEMPVAIEQAYTTIERTLQHYGLTLQHVVKETIHTTQLDALKANRAVRRKFYGKDFPAATWVQVNRLFEPAQVIEVEVIAVIPE